MANFRLQVLFLIVVLPILVACTGNVESKSDGWNPAISVNGTVYIGTKDGEVIAVVDDSSGNLQAKWSFPSNQGQDNLSGVYNTPVVNGNLVYVNGIDGFLYALDRETGQLTGNGWKRPENFFEQPEPLVAGPAYDPVNDIVLSPSEDGKVYAYTAKNGNEFWDPFLTGGPIWSTPAVQDGVAYFGSHDHKVYAVSLSDGKEQWQFETGGVVAGKPLVFDGKVIAGSFDKSLYGLSLKDGVPQWSIEGDNWFWAGAVTDGRTIFAPNMDGNIYALDRSGNLLWKHDVGSAIVSTPVLVPNGLVVAGKDGKLLLLNTSTENLSWQREKHSIQFRDTEIKAPLFSVGDSVYVGLQNRTVRRIDFKEGQRPVWCLDTRGEAGCIN